MKCILEDVTNDYYDYNECYHAYNKARADEERELITKHYMWERDFSSGFAKGYAGNDLKNKNLKKEIAKYLCGYNMEYDIIADILKISKDEITAIAYNLNDKYKTLTKKKREKIIQIKFDDKNDSKDLIRGRIEGMAAEKINTLIRMCKVYDFFNCDVCWATDIDYYQIEKICENPLNGFKELVKDISEGKFPKENSNTDDTINPYDKRKEEMTKNYKEGYNAGIHKQIREMAETMLQNGYDISEVIKISKLTEKEIEEIKKTMK